MELVDVAEAPPLADEDAVRPTAAVLVLEGEEPDTASKLQSESVRLPKAAVLDCFSISGLHCISNRRTLCRGNHTSKNACTSVYFCTIVIVFN